MKTIIILSLLAFTVNAETRLIIPFSTTHIGSGDFNNHNPGLGIEYKSDLVYSAMYLKHNSYNESSLYLTVSKEHNINDFSYSYGLTVANGYEAVNESGLLLTPVISVTYKNIRIATSFPAGQLFCPEGVECADFVNVQYVYGF